MTRRRLIAFAAPAFALGVEIGAIVRRRFRARQPVPKAPLLGQLRQELALTPAQVAQLEKILDDAAVKFGQLHARGHQLRAESRERIRAILDEKQKQKYNDQLEQLGRPLPW